MIDAKEPMIWFGMQLVRQAAVLAKTVQQELGGGKMDKTDLSPVTVADFAIQALVGQALKKTFPEEALVGEENSGDLRQAAHAKTLAALVEQVARVVPGASADDVCHWIDYGCAEPETQFWTLDPVDGTKGFLRGGHYAIALAFIKKGEVELGILGCPHLNTLCKTDMGREGALLIAKRGAGAWITTLSSSGGELLPLQVSGVENPMYARLMRSVESGHTNVGEIDLVAEHLGTEAAPVQMDSQAKYGVLAGGGGEILLRLLSPGKEDYKERIWDQAAGAIILEEAGGKITDLYGMPLDFSQGRSLAKNTGIIASNKLLHSVTLEAVQRACKLP